MNPNNPYLDDEIDLKEFFRVVWEGRKLIILITAVFAISSTIFSLLLTNYYQSTALMDVRDSAEDPSMLSQYSGVASLMGVNLPGSGDSRGIKAIELIQSRKFVKHLLTFENILPSIMASKSYDSDTKELLFDQKIYDSETKVWKRKSKKNYQQKPSYLEAHREYIENMISITQDMKTGLISIKIEHISPIFAKDFLELIIGEANVLLRNKDIEQSSQALKYLESELSETPFVVIQESINTLREAQLEKQMLAQINEDYILVEIDPPFISENKSKPNRLIICFIGTILGGILSVLIVSIRYYFLGGKEINNYTSV